MEDLGYDFPTSPRWSTIPPSAPQGLLAEARDFRDKEKALPDPLPHGFLGAKMGRGTKKCVFEIFPHPKVSQQKYH